MKHEFKVTKSKEQTVYTLESASSGGTSSGSVASVSTALGGVQRRPTDSIFAQEAKKDETPKPRNFVAKNAKMGGAGKMKDKSKTLPRHEKHKKPVAEDHEIQMAGSELQSIAKNAVHLLDLVKKYSEQEGLQAWQQSKITKAADYLNSVLQSINGEQINLEGVGIPFRGVGGAFNRGDDERHDLDTPNNYAVAIDGRTWKVFADQRQAQNIAKSLQAKGKKATVHTTGANPTESMEETGVTEDTIRPKLAEALKQLGFKGPFKLGDLPKWLAELTSDNGRFNEDSSIMIKGNDPDYDEWVAKGYDYGYSHGQEHGYQTNLSAQQVFKSAKANYDIDHKQPNNDYTMELASKLAEKIPQGADVDYYIKDFAKSTAPQFKGKNPAKRKQMAIAAYYGSKQKKK